MKFLQTLAYIVLGLIIGALVVFGIMHHQTQPKVTQAEALINKLSNNNVTIVQNFSVNSAIQGFVISAKGSSDKRGIVFTDSQGQYIVDGNLIDLNGNSLAQQEYYKYVQPQAATNAYKTIAQTAWIQQGSDNAPHKLYAVVDPNCTFCHAAFLALQPKIASGQLTVRWIVIGLIKPDSKAKALAILTAKDPLQALLQNEQTFNVQTEEGGIAPLAANTSVSTTKFDTNMAFAQQNQIMQTPTFFYKDNGGVAQMQAGMPQGAAMDTLINNVSNQF